ncbi:MAG: bifunctional UDP-N-acetylglucosamine diphosphorylase/glucosamine-1-phosphate N-acetyltransferase GlmU [Chloroflexota bacterium]
MTPSAAIILAAGQGTRMRSRLPKVLHPLAGRPMIEHVLLAVAETGASPAIVVVGHGAAAVEALLEDRAGTLTVRQTAQLGTADAVRVALDQVPAGTRSVLVTMGDAPLLPGELLAALHTEHVASGAVMTLLSVQVADASGYGRIVRDPTGAVTEIREEAQLDDATRDISEVNAGSYCFDLAWLCEALPRVETSPAGELYITDLLGMAVADGRRTAVVTGHEADVAMGINDRVALARAEVVLQRRIAERHMRAGVTIVDPASTRIDATVEIGQDARIEPGSTLLGHAIIGDDAIIGPNAYVADSRIGPRTRVWASVVEASVVAEDVEIGPYSHLRPGCEIGPGCRIGNYAEIKHSRLGADTQQHHFSYLGDASVGERVNVGAGTVTANFDGSLKHPTTIGDDVFLGVDTMLRAPITIGAGAKTGAGAVVTRDVAPGTTVVGMPARPIQLRRRRAATIAEPTSQPGGSPTPHDA